MFAKHIFVKGLMPRIYKELSTLDKKTNHLIEKKI